MELWDIYNIKREITGKVVERDNYDFLDNEYHLVAIIWVVNKKGEFLIQRRALDKELLPGLLATHGGSVLRGESSVEGAIRETYEEVGVTLNREELTLFSSRFHGTTLYDNYIVHKEFDLSECVIDPEEVDSCMVMTYDEIKSAVQSGDFYNYERVQVNGYFDLIKGLI